METWTEQIISQIVAAKKGNKDLAIFYMAGNPDGEWRVAVGNSSGCVMLGECSGDIEVDGETLSEALQFALYQTREWKR